MSFEKIPSKTSPRGIFSGLFCSTPASSEAKGSKGAFSVEPAASGGEDWKGSTLTGGGGGGGGDGGGGDGDGGDGNGEGGGGGTATMMHGTR